MNKPKREQRKKTQQKKNYGRSKWRAVNIVRAGQSKENVDAIV